MAGVRELNVSRVALQPGSYPSPGETIQLSFFDSIWVSVPHMQRIFLYPDTADASFAAILSSLKSSLALMLPSFHPFAGKLAYNSSDDKAIIDCSASAIHEGVAIIEAESNLDIHHIAKEEVLDLELFLQLVPNITMLELPIEVFAVQVTRFANGGVALGTAIHHTVADGRGLWQFMEAWASTCRTGSVPSVFMPVHDRAIIKYPEGDKIAKNFTKEVAPDLPKLTIAPRSLQERLLRTRRTFLVDASTIRSWKKLARHENPSTFVCIAARVLVTVASVREFADDDGPLIAAFLTDCRSRLDPPIDDGYTGNCVSYCFASMTASEVAGPDGFVPACIALKQETAPIIKKGLRGGRSGIVKDMDPSGITHIVKITIRHTEAIDALIVYFKRNGTMQCTDQWGGNGGQVTEINLKTNEYITSVKGYVSDYHGIYLMRSLELKTNLNVYGPYGYEVGKTFEFLAPPHGKIIGFHARSGQFLVALGVYVQGYTKKLLQCCGGSMSDEDMDLTEDTGVGNVNIHHADAIERTPFWDGNAGAITKETAPIIKKETCGGPGGYEKDMDLTGITRIYKISIRHAVAIDSLMVYFERNGTTQHTDNWGGDGGKLTEINLKTNEYIRCVKGYANKFNDGFAVRSLVLVTNLAIYGPYGYESGQTFEFLAPHGQIIGFHARSGLYLDTLGVYVQGFIKKLVLCGGSGGLSKDMDLTGVTRIVNIHIRHSKAIDALSVSFDRRGTIETSQWGGDTGVLAKIKLRQNEYITSVRGYIGYIHNLFIVRSLELRTNLTSYGPYGKREGTPFELSAHGGQIIGFHGRSGSYLDAIGVYVLELNLTRQILQWPE